MRFALCAIWLGVGATVLMDAWTTFLKRAFGFQMLNYAMVGRWIGHFRHGKFTHDSIATASTVRGERIRGLVGALCDRGFICCAASRRLGSQLGQSPDYAPSIGHWSPDGGRAVLRDAASHGRRSSSVEDAKPEHGPPAQHHEPRSFRHRALCFRRTMVSSGWERVTCGWRLPFNSAAAMARECTPSLSRKPSDNKHHVSSCARSLVRCPALKQEDLSAAIEGREQEGGAEPTGN